MASASAAKKRKDVSVLQSFTRVQRHKSSEARRPTRDAGPRKVTKASFDQTKNSMRDRARAMKTMVARLTKSGALNDVGFTPKQPSAEFASQVSSNTVRMEKETFRSNAERMEQPTTPDISIETPVTRSRGPFRERLRTNSHSRVSLSQSGTHHDDGVIQRLQARPGPKSSTTRRPLNNFRVRRKVHFAGTDLIQPFHASDSPSVIRTAANLARTSRPISDRFSNLRHSSIFKTDIPARDLRLKSGGYQQPRTYRG